MFLAIAVTRQAEKVTITSHDKVTHVLLPTNSCTLAQHAAPLLSTQHQVLILQANHALDAWPFVHQK
jgi:hypothetical protein